MKIISAAVFALLLMVSVGATGAHAQTESTTDAAAQARIESLIEQIASLQAQIKLLQTNNSDLQSEVTKLRLESQLRLGSEGEEVRTLQKLLSTDSTIYPEGLVTGFFGPLTETAVKRFQAKLKIEQAGAVGPQTLARLNEMLSSVSGNLPSDFLSSRVKIEVKIKDGKEEIKIEIKCDSSGSGNECKDEDDMKDEDEEEEEDDDEEDEDDDEEDEDEDEDDEEEDEDEDDD